MGLATGLAHSGDQRLERPYEPTHIVGYAYDGTRSNRSDLLIDGVPSTATANENEVIASYVPPSDMVRSSGSRRRPSTRSSATPRAASPA